MVEFNLLPDIKMEYLRTKRLEHLVITISAIVGGISLALFIFLFVFVQVVQKVQINNLNGQISTSTIKIKNNTNLNKILTVQKQLETIPTLEDQAPQTSKLFGYLAQLTPPAATISSLQLSFTANDVTINGGADSLATVNTYVDTLKYATYDNATTGTKNNAAFSDVILSSFSYSSSTTTSQGGSPAQYSISFDFSPALFNGADTVTLVVPNEITTNSILNQPTLFKAEPSSLGS